MVKKRGSFEDFPVDNLKRTEQFLLALFRTNNTFYVVNWLTSDVAISLLLPLFGFIRWRQFVAKCCFFSEEGTVRNGDKGEGGVVNRK